MGTLLVSIADASRMLSVSQDTLRRLVARKQLRAVRIARRVMVPSCELERVCKRGVQYAREAG